MDRTARLLDTSAPQAIRGARGMLDALLMVSPRLAVLHTSESKETWEALITAQLRRNPEQAITIIRWRRSQHVGIP